MVDIKLTKAIVKGMVTYIPGAAYLLEKKKRTSKHSGIHAEFCYTLWLSILSTFDENGIKPYFEKIGELGSGGSVGVGICALLTGTKKFFALAFKNNFVKDSNLKLLDEIFVLLKNKTPIPNHFKQLNIQISNNDFPSHLISPRFNENNFIAELRNEINSDCLCSKYLNILYEWHKKPPLNLDLVFSRAVMEHVNEPDQVYKHIANHQKSGAYTFHDIEFHSHGITKNINGHLNINKWVWKIISGNRSYYLNRWMFLDHIHALESLNIKIINTRKVTENEKDSSNEVLIGATIFAEYLNT